MNFADDDVDVLKEAVAGDPLNGEACLALGMAFRRRGDLDQAIRFLLRAATLSPARAEAHYILARCYWRQSDFEHALARLRTTLELCPAHADALNLTGLILLDPLGRPEQAERSLRLALQANPNHADAYVNLGNIHHLRGERALAEQSYLRASELDPGNADVWTNLGVLWQEQNDIRKALGLYERALAVNPSHANSHWNRATALLVSGAFEEGWREFEWRPGGPEVSPRPFPRPGLIKTPAPFSTVLVHDEQGLGDTIQFARFLPMLQAGGSNIILECHPALATLMSYCDGAAHVVPRTAPGEPPLPYDCHVPLMSLPLYFNTTWTTIPDQVPYFRIPEESIGLWKERLGAGSGLKVGVCWQGNPRHKGDRQRSVALEQLHPIMHIPGIRWFSLQAGKGTEQLADLPAGVNVTSFNGKAGDEVPDMSDTAAIIMNLDLVISVDTAVAHLAGALGKRVWTMLPFAPDWRWRLRRTTTPWYPTMKLFRQPSEGDWNSVVDAVAAALRELLTASPAKGDQAENEMQELMRAAVASLRIGDYREAEELCRNALRLSPGEPETLNMLGMVLEGEGKSREAMDMYRDALRERPEYADAHYNLGNAYAGTGHAGEAVASYYAAIQFLPTFFEAHINLANVLKRQGSREKALEHLYRAHLLKPDHPVVLKNLGSLLLELKRYDDALSYSRAALQFAPGDPEILGNLGALYLVKEDTDAAIQHCRSALVLKPDLVAAHITLGLAYARQKKFDAAYESFQEVVRLQPDHPDVYDYIGSMLAERGYHEDAASCFRKSLSLRPDRVESHLRLCAAMQAQGRYLEAADCCRQALQYQPHSAMAYNELGNTLRVLGHHEEALACFRRVLEIDPAVVEAQFNIGVTLGEQHDFDGAIGAYDQALRMKPDYPEAHLNKGMILLLLGRSAEGWKEYEWRARIKDAARTANFREYARRQWDGSPIEGKRVLVHFEQGLGDTIQFIRYLPLVKGKGASVTFECQKELVPLLRGFPGIDTLIEGVSDTSGAESDAHVPLLSLPSVLGATDPAKALPVPYLHADPARAEEWSRRFSGNDLHVGIVWAGSAVHKNDRLRSCSFADLQPLTKISGVRLHGLQMGAAASQRTDPAIADLGREIADFADTAGIIENLDLLIAVDTAAAHLAGAMGKRVWMMLPHVPDWRWLLEREDTPWYPTMRLFRQAETGGWPPVVSRIGEMLRDLVATLRPGER